MEYRRLILWYDHFLDNTNEPLNMMTRLPQMPYITYVPCDYRMRYLGYHHGIPHQMAQQHDCILRTQARNVTWLVALHDVDE